MRDALGISWVTVRKGRKKVRSFCCVHVFPANRSNNGVDPRGLEPLASAMRGRSEGFAAVRYRSKNRLNKPNPRIVPPRMFAIVRAGCRQIVVSCISKSWASEETLFIDRQVYSTPVHVVLEGSVQAARERMACRQQTGSMQDPASELLRIPLLGTPVNRPPVDAPDLLGWHHGWCRPVIETRVGNEEEQAPVSDEEKNKALVRR